MRTPLLELQEPEKMVGCKRNVFSAGITSVGVPLLALVEHEAFHASTNA